jgi:hypothetical protein
MVYFVLNPYDVLQLGLYILCLLLPTLEGYIGAVLLLERRFLILVEAYWSG